MTQAMTTIPTEKLVLKTVDLAARLRRGETPLFASVNGHAQALIVHNPLPELAGPSIHNRRKV